MTAKESFSKRNKEYIILLLGFLLTTICGSILTYNFQKRSWEHQHEVELQDKERQQAEYVFSEISSLMDSRIYNMRRLFLGKANKIDEVELNNMV